MPQGDKSSYTDKQKRQAEHIEAGYEKKGLSMKTAEAELGPRKQTHRGGKKSGSGRRRTNCNYASLTANKSVYLRAVPRWSKRAQQFSDLKFEGFLKASILSWIARKSSKTQSPSGHLHSFDKVTLKLTP